jgi:hypothetical protein
MRNTGSRSPEGTRQVINQVVREKVEVTLHRKLVELNPNVKCVHESSDAEIESENFGQFLPNFPAAPDVNRIN